MNETIDQKATSILAGVRDNLLKPMAKEIEQKQQNNCDELIKAIGELKSALESKIAVLVSHKSQQQQFLQDYHYPPQNQLYDIPYQRTSCI